MAPSDSAPGDDGYPTPSKQVDALHAYLAVKMPRVSRHLVETVVQELAPTKAEAVKTLAGRLERLLKQLGIRINHATGLEAAARIQGQANWHTTPLLLRAAPWAVNDVMPSAFPRAQGLLSVSPAKVPVVLDRSAGRYERHTDVIGDDWEKALQLRMQIQTELDANPRFHCAECMTPVYLVARREDKKLTFRHTLEDGRCSAVTRGSGSQDEIDARRYNGVKESWLHLEMKRWIAECLRADGRFTGIDIEKRWTDEFTGEWRVPDVLAVYNGVRVAFEIQLSTTYINVIAKRRKFYQEKGGLLFWVFAHFKEGERRLTQDDVFFNNNRNAFIVNAHTRDQSVEQKRFVLECCWSEPLPGGRTGPMKRATVPFDALTLDQVAQRAYFFDFDGARAKLAQDADRLREMRRAVLRQRFDAFYEGYLAERNVPEEEWQTLRRDLAGESIELPEYPWKLPKTLLNSLYSAKYGRVFGWKYSNFIEVAHTMESGRMRRHFHYFRKALMAYDRADLVRSQDGSGKWAAKVAVYRARMREGDPEYAPDHEHDALVSLVFPEVLGSAD